MSGNIQTWAVEIDQGGINWTPIAICFSEKQAKELAEAPHIVGFGKPVRIRKRGEYAGRAAPAN